MSDKNGNDYNTEEWDVSDVIVFSDEEKAEMRKQNNMKRYVREYKLTGFLLKCFAFVSSAAIIALIISILMNL